MVTKVNPKTQSPKHEEPKAEKKGRESFKLSKEAYKVAVPENFNFAEYKPLKKKNFETDELYYMHRAAEMQFRAGAFVQRATDAKLNGANRATAGKAKRLIKLTEKMAELRKQLEEQGIDVKAILATTA